MDRVYKQVKANTAGTVAAGKYASIDLIVSPAEIPDEGETLTITHSSIVRTYTFSLTSGISTQTINAPVSRTCRIGSTPRETLNNLVNTIHSNVHDTSLGKDDTISTAVSSPTVTGTGQMTIYSNAKIQGDITVGGTWGSTVSGNNTTGEAVSGYNDGVWTAIQGTGSPMELLIRNPSSKAYNAGPPVNGLKKVIVTLPSDVIIPLETWGCNVVTNLFR